MIDASSFGTMTINGRTYHSDLKIFPDGRITDRWWRRRGHALAVDDILDLIDATPQIILVGTGTSGQLRPDASLSPFLRERKINVVAKPTPQAMDIYNQQVAAGIVVGACFHLTC